MQKIEIIEGDRTIELTKFLEELSIKINEQTLAINELIEREEDRPQFLAPSIWLTDTEKEDESCCVCGSDRREVSGCCLYRKIH